ncbi:DUF4123 domain-containing protein [Larsenimonas rhizosphaerae]|uniref:DUF4123 domain-containing protein n=1 Tax=Larsenimonas rhizosphaerae TaxID=2944682 RepID=A0AA41ZFA0_9GAMM|nr:DUF4123 domain-containing protein [Larsenimonas rhizosphaerae]MCM2130776.1 DUF4123 domain-containing protein [Larsenimonas rhizosphaerae]MCX2523480.1 DUF4123 domain-containing protein [Larsenimonas rhizosphaerae]
MTTWLLHDHLNGSLDIKEGVEFAGALAPRQRSDLHALTPHLYRLDEHALDAIREQTNRRWQHKLPPVVCAILHADTDARILREQLSRFCLFGVQKGQTRYCRYFDPRVMTHLRWILTNGQLHSLLGHIQHWELMDSNGQWIVTSPPESSAGRMIRLILDEQQRRYLELLPAIRECLKHWRAMYPDKLRDDAEAGPHLAHRFDRAQALGLGDMKDCLALVLHEVLVHPRVTDHPKVASVISAVKEGASYQRTTAHWSPEDWQTIQKQLNAEGRVT